MLVTNIVGATEEEEEDSEPAAAGVWKKCTDHR